MNFTSKDDSTPLNVAHRGGAGLRPENTLRAFLDAAKQGCDGAELDVQLSKDGKLFVFHDFHLSPELCRDESGRWLRRPRGPICALNSEEIRGFDVGRARPGSRYARRHPDVQPCDQQRIPRLRDVIAAVRAIRDAFLLFIEIKTSIRDPSLSAAPERVADAVIAELRNLHALNTAILVGFDWRALVHAKRLEPGIRCWFTSPPDWRRRLIRGEAWAAGFGPSRFGGSLTHAIAAAGGDGWFCPQGEADMRSVEEARQLNLKVGVWTVNSVRRMRRLIRINVDAICTDRPDRLAALIASHSPSNSAVDR